MKRHMKYQNYIRSRSSAHYPGAQLPLIPEQVGLPALYIPGSVRNGRRVYSRGQLVVAGDVEEGAQLMAAGDILIWGRLMGEAHAGIDNDGQAAVRALAFFTEHIHIGDYRIDTAIPIARRWVRVSCASQPGAWSCCPGLLTRISDL